MESNINNIETNCDKIIVLNSLSKSILLAKKSSEVVSVNAMDIFNILLNKKGINGISFDDLKISADIKNLKVLKSQSEIKSLIEIKAEYALVEFQLTSIFQNKLISFKEVKFIIENGYLIKNGELIPVSVSSIQFSETLANQFSNLGNLPLKYSLELFSERGNNRFVTFKNEQLNINEIINCNKYQGKSSLFVRELYDYQLDGLKWLQYCCLNRIGGILGDDMGLGKTAQIIALTSWIVESKILERILIVVPSTLIENWRREFVFFAPSLNPYIHHGNIRTGSVDLLTSQDIVITSYSMIINDQYLFNKIKWGAVILDEASLIKNPRSERKLALSNLDSDVRIAMTGTPVENSLIDLWSIGDFVIPGYFGTIESFTSKYIKRNIEQTIVESDLNLLENEVSFIMLRRKKEDVLDSLPDKIDIHQALVMNQNEATLYNEQRESILDQIDSKASGNILSMILELRQYTTHPLLLEEQQLGLSDINILMNTSTKFKRTIEILEEIKARKEKVLIFTEYLKMIDTFKRILKDYYKINIYTIDGRVDVPDRQKRIDDFSTEEGFAIMVLNPKTAGMGLNITAANHVIHYTRQWNPALEEQASARAYRNKQSKDVNVYYLYYVNTIEETIDNRLRAKSTLSGEVITVTDSENSIDTYLESLSKNPLIK